MRSMADKHWYYPSIIIGCGIDEEGLRAEEMTCVRSEVTCPGCIAQILADKKICGACALGAARFTVDPPPPHVCDPALS